MVSKKPYDNPVEDEYVEPGHDVIPDVIPDGTAIRRLDVQVQKQLASLTDAVDRLQKRIEELERRQAW